MIRSIGSEWGGDKWKPAKRVSVCDGMYERANGIGRKRENGKEREVVLGGGQNSK